MKGGVKVKKNLRTSREGDAYIRALGKLQSSEIAFTTTFSSTGRRCPSNNPATSAAGFSHFTLRRVSGEFAKIVLLALAVPFIDDEFLHGDFDGFF